MSQPVIPKQNRTPRELTDERTATSSVRLNKDGTLTRTNYFAPHFYKNNGAWDKIDTTLQEDDNAADSGNIFGKALGKAESLVGSPNSFIEKANDWQARFTPSDFSGGMVRIKEGSTQIGFSPVNANTVTPVITTDSDGQQTVQYNNLWDNVDVHYVVGTDSVKEAIILKNKSAASQVQFKIDGANLQKPAKPSTPKDVQPAFNITGALGNQFGISPANLILNKFGLVSGDGSGLTQSYNNGTYTVGVDSSYIQQLPRDAFPAVIDPGVYRSSFGTLASGNYISFKTDGTVCYSNVCGLYAGTLYDSNNNLQDWRGALYAPYDWFRNNSITLTHANLHLSKNMATNYYTGNTNTHTYGVGHAYCLNSYNCVDAWYDQQNISTTGDLNATSIYQNAIASGDFGAWLMIGDTDSSTSSFKFFNPDYSYVDFTYDDNLSSPSFAAPANGQIYVDPQASFTLNTETNPNNSTPLNYEMMITDGSNGSGMVISSGSPQPSTLWTVPDGVLQDGSTYYVQALSYDPSTGLSSPWSAPVQFKVDSREGKDKTQTYDTLGPATVDLATGNLSTDISSHTTAALAGDIGLNLSYNSPLKSRPGLVGQYWNVASGYPGNTPTSPPNLTRVDQNINFNWNTGSPDSTITSSWFYTLWSGYFVAPATGTYYFGGINDDALTITVNGTMLYNNGGCYSGPCYGSTITLTAGQVVPFQATYEQATGPDYVQLYVKGPVAEQIVPQSWFQTGVRPLQQHNGLVGHYYSYSDTGSPPALPNSGTSGLFLTRTDPVVSFNWNSGSPIPNGAATNFEAQWTGYITVPATGSYVFGTTSDDGSNVSVTVGGTNQTVYNNWADHGPTTGYGSAVSLVAGQSYPITVDYYQHYGGDTMALLVEPLGGASEIVPSSWLSPQAQTLPDGWGLGIDPDGSVSYTHLNANQNNAILTNSTGDTYDYTWNGTAYVPPTNSYGKLQRNTDGTFTMQDTDGKTYVFDTSGNLVSMTNPVDDSHPAALQYTYTSIYSGGPVTIHQITDGVTPNRNAIVYYSGASQCGSVPSGYSAAPTNMLCAMQTNDGRTTYFYYDSNGNLAEVAKPGNDDTTYQYQAVQNTAGETVGYQLVGVRNNLANDAIVASQRSDDQSTYTQIGYDTLGRVTTVTQPAATTGATPIANTVQYLPGTIGYVNGNPATGYYGATKEHVVNATEPNGYTEEVEFDNLFRTTTEHDILGQATSSQWNPIKDLEYSTTNPEGQITSYVYDGDDRVTAQYGPAPAGWFTSTTDPVTGYTDTTPQSAHTNQVAERTSTYDGGMTGPAVTYQAVQEPSSNNASLTGAPLLHTTNIASDGTISHDWGSTPPVSNYSGNWGFNMTGKMILPTTGNWTFSLTSDEGIRMWIDNQLVVDDWKDNAISTSPTSAQLEVHPGYTYNNTTAGTMHDFRINYYHLGGDANFSLSMTPPGGSQSTQVASYFTPDYSLETSSTTYDSTYGNATTTTNYGSSPELGLVNSTATDPSGLNLTTSNTYEQQGATGSYLRQLSHTLPGGSATGYGYYVGSDTATNPCVTGSPAAYQGGMLKTTTNPNGETVMNVYDDTGNIVATQTNSDSWECKTYDARGRVTQDVIPAKSGEASRTVTYNYNVGGNPFVTSVTDPQGTISTTTDLLGRTVSYTDSIGSTTTTSYDNLGRLSSETSPMGTETFTYNNYNQQTDEKLGTTDLAQSSYDTYGRLSAVTFPNAGTMNEAIGYDSTTGAQNSVTYNTSDGESTNDATTLTQSGKIQYDVVSAGSNSLWYTYGYNAADELTSMNVGPHTYSYGFGTENAGCASGTNTNAGKDGNRTSQTIDGTSNYYCYNSADQLVSSSDATADAAQYDAYGNMTQIGSNGSPLRLYYDSSDRNWGLVQYDGSGNGNAMYYSRDAQDRLNYREHDTISAWNWNMDGQYWYSYTGSGDTPTLSTMPRGMSLRSMYSYQVVRR